MVENELDHQGDFGKMGARNGHPPEDGRAVISVSEDQDDPLVARVFPHEIMFGRPPSLIWEVKWNLLQREVMEVL